MSMWGTPKNFCLAFIDELEKQLFIKNHKNQNFEKIAGDIKILHKCTKNHNYRDRQNYLSFWAIFALLPP